MYGSPVNLNEVSHFSTHFNTMSSTSMKRQIICSIFKYTVSHFMVNKMSGTCKAGLCTWYSKEYQKCAQVLPKTKLLVKQMSSWEIEIKVLIAETGKKNEKYIMNCKYIHIGSFVVNYLMLKKTVLLYTKTNFRMQKASLILASTVQKQTEVWIQRWQCFRELRNRNKKSLSRAILFA